MRFTITLVCFILIFSYAKSQNTETKWYSETINNGIIIQNSFPKGGPYNGPTKKHFNYSYLVFFSRIINQTEKSIELIVNFPADSIGIPNAPDTFVKLFVPPDKMTLEKQNLFSYGITEFESFNKSTKIQKTLNPCEDYLFYVVAIFYQTTADAQNQQRGGNRTELFLEGQDLYYKMPPQIDYMPCGHINFMN